MTEPPELMARLGGIFDIAEKIKPAKSVDPRKGKEEIWLLKKCL